MTDHYVTVNPVSGVRIRSLLLLGLVHRRAAASVASIADFRRHRNRRLLRSGWESGGYTQTSGRGWDQAFM